MSDISNRKAGKTVNSIQDLWEQFLPTKSRQGKNLYLSYFQSKFSMETDRYRRIPWPHLSESLSPDPYGAWSRVVSQGQTRKRLSLWKWHTLHFNKSEHIPQQCFSIDSSYQDALLLCNSAFDTFSTIHVLSGTEGKGMKRILGEFVLLLVAKPRAHRSSVHCQYPSAESFIAFRLVWHQSNANLKTGIYLNYHLCTTPNWSSNLCD